MRHFITNHVIEPAPGGAIGKEYAVIIDIGENGNPSGIALGGRYDDEYVKTPQGWKFKSRTFTPSRSRGSAAACGRWTRWTAGKYSVRAATERGATVQVRVMRQWGVYVVGACSCWHAARRAHSRR